jgi:hypothetical protein
MLKTTVVECRCGRMHVIRQEQDDVKILRQSEIVKCNVCSPIESGNYRRGHIER